MTASPPFLAIVLLVILSLCHDSGGKLSPSSKIDECQVCKVLTDSFSQWMDKTSRGKFEGGDAAWEESKLKSYSRSEIRLVEVQEGLCSELTRHKDQCYLLAEETEQLLDKWWFSEDPASADLYTWLCIETLLQCCPPGHFGENCSQCLKGENDLICSGHGKCMGEGTRKGDGKCKCINKFDGERCDVCTVNHFQSDNKCIECHASCEGCYDSGQASCLDCRPGWQNIEGFCIDINECESNPCQKNQFCINEEGSHECVPCHKSCAVCDGRGSTNCTQCADDYIFWFDTCVERSSKEMLLTKLLQKMLLYVGLLVMSLFVVRRSKMLGSVVIVFIGMYIYFAEDNSGIINYVQMIYI